MAVAVSFSAPRRRDQSSSGVGNAVGDEIELDDLATIGGVGKAQAENLRVIPGLLETGGGGLILRLGLHDGEKLVSSVTEKVVGTLARAAGGTVAANDNPAIRERALLSNLFIRLAGGVQLGQDQRATGISLRGHR